MLSGEDSPSPSNTKTGLKDTGHPISLLFTPPAFPKHVSTQRTLIHHSKASDLATMCMSEPIPGSAPLEEDPRQLWLALLIWTGNHSKKPSSSSPSSRLFPQALTCILKRLIMG